MGKPQIAVRIPPPLLAELNQYVERVGTSKTNVIISAIAAYLGCVETVPLSQRVSELELQTKELRTLIESYSCTEEGNQ
ncbi:MAG: DNA-binding domain-containing protein [Microcystis panniformis Mp_MB_F_20051200_S9]|uniref:DNA-binding domain-containing protein n=1 Tax=Microcystis panniformis Mp_MB_F_20051200_S9 TaxID=2486223 RepID=A0A552Q695_9CHRO|nr:MAG: DNA-binding domain-containing protein [Microcystis panniformis Mp_MB_F_20080800_S26D]TRV51101.1 MAG: DNA-binding domain-containing protein [Microcystis panniformis Mp_GB_SS_20050300_S99]TRV56048.1 MAG: DNA-binding domain-containing protein [Microcystis panniformis Mp_GB_SS_20050300_S99D]TRV56798.1 MAG: DNA-binding domain-containing protein [Microcystis panniformis Mp_MB_F_20080800_S26]TRV64732.1 MAG: DNA-binding domain-containing protein [Microcystis panniformis Mp_MB_F_20051200_S9]TRV